ncbi:MAG TPA: HEAT repeat domain-containing protein [Bryobacteraceae bacterium]|nr:HEAT repeat domain-containing protein [Bryobacteraceae bacterium]
MNCEEARRQLPLLLYKELSFDEEESLEQHLAGCEACRAEFQRAIYLQRAVDDAGVELNSTLLADCRRRLRESTTLSSSGAARAAWQPPVPALFAMPAYLFKLVACAALIALGFFAARYVPGAQDAYGSLGSAPAPSRVRYVDPAGSGKVQIVIEETRERTLSGDIGNDSIRRLLLAAAVNSADPGVRVESMDILKARVASLDVRQTLIQALQHDPDPGVRLKALEVLRAAAGDDDTRRAVAGVLLADRNEGVRTQAIDLLVQKREPAMVGFFQELIRKEENNYVRMRCQKALHEMNASVEMF